MMREIIIFDESNGESHKGKLARELANRIGVRYIDNLEELKEEVNNG